MAYGMLVIPPMNTVQMLVVGGQSDDDVTTVCIRFGDSVQPRRVTQSNLGEVGSVRPGVRDGEPSYNLFLPQVDDDNVFVPIVDIGKEQKSEPLPDPQQLPHFFVHVNRLPGFPVVGVGNDNVSIT